MLNIVIASVALSLMGAIVKTTSGGVSPVYVIWFRSLLHLVFLAPLLFNQGFKIQQPKNALLRGLCGSLGMALYYYCIRCLPLAIANAIFWTAPIFTLLLNSFREQRRLHLSETLSLLLVMMGIGLISLSGDSGLKEVGMTTLFLAILSSLAIGASYFFLGEQSRSKENVFSVTYSFSYLILIFTTPFAVTNAPTSFTFGLGFTLTAVAIFAMIYQYFISKAYAVLNTDQAASIQSVVIPVMSVLIDQVLFHHRLNTISALGIGILMFSQLLKGISLKPMIKVACVLVVIFLGFIALPLKAHAFSANDLQGTWRLVKYDTIKPDGQDIAWCKGYFGTLSYFGNRMSVSINCIKRSSNDRVTAKKSDMVFYSGTFEFQEPNIIIHHVENSSDPHRIGHDHIRYASVIGDEVVLTGVGLKGNIQVIWKKIGDRMGL